LNMEKGFRLTTKKCRYRSKATAKKFGINFAVLAPFGEQWERKEGEEILILVQGQGAITLAKVNEVSIVFKKLICSTLICIHDFSWQSPHSIHSIWFNL